MYIRRLPVYLVLDCSGALAGEPIEAIRQGVKALLADLRTDPQALETACVSVITFNYEARQLRPLSEVMEFHEPELEACGPRSLGAALRLLEKCIEREVWRGNRHEKGDWEPLVFLLIAGNPTDDWLEAADRIRAKRLAGIIALVSGSNVDTAVLQRLTEVIVRLESLQPDTMKAFFQWRSNFEIHQDDRTGIWMH